MLVVLFLIFLNLTVLSALPGGNPGPLNDLWKYSPSTGSWTYYAFPGTPGDQYFQNGSTLSRNVFPGDRYCMVDRWKTPGGTYPILFGGSRVQSMIYKVNTLSLIPTTLPSILQPISHKRPHYHHCKAPPLLVPTTPNATNFTARSTNGCERCMDVQHGWWST